MKLTILGEAADYLCDYTYREIIDEMKQLPPKKMVELYNEFLQTPVPADPRLSDLTPQMITLGLLSSALYETKIDTSVIRGNPLGGLGAIVTINNDVRGLDFHNFQMAYATFEPGTGYNTIFNRRSGHELIAQGNALNGARFNDKSGTLAQIGIDSDTPSIIMYENNALWGADLGDMVVRRYI